MALSRTTTAATFWANAIRDLKIDQTAETLHFEKYLLINRAVRAVVGQFFSLMSNAYLNSSALTIVSDVASLSSLSIARLGEEVKLTVTSSALTNKVCRPLSIDGLKSWRSGARQNKNMIVYAYQGDSLVFRKGDSLASYGTTVTLIFPQMPVEVAADTDFIDLPDSALEIAQLKLQKILASRYGVSLPNYDQDIAAAVVGLYQSSGQVFKLEDLAEKIKALA